MKFKFWQLVNKFRTAWATGFSKSSARPSTPTYTELPTQPEGFYARQYYEYMSRRNPETYKASTAMKPIELYQANEKSMIKIGTLDFKTWRSLAKRN